MRCFIQDLSLNVHSHLDIFLQGSSSSFNNHWRYQQCYHELLGRKSASFLWCINACMNLNGTQWLVEMDLKNFEKDRKFFGTVLKIWQKNNCGRTVFLEQFFKGFCDAIGLKQSVEGTLKVLGNFLETVLDKVHFIVNLYSFPVSPLSQANPSFPRVRDLSTSQTEQLPKLPHPRDISTIALVCIFSSNISHSYENQKNSIIKG